MSRFRGFGHEKTPEMLNSQGFRISLVLDQRLLNSLSLRRLPGTSENTRENRDGLAFSARLCLILAVSVSKDRDPRLQLKPRME